MPAPIPQNCAWVGGVSPADMPVGTAGLDRIAAIDARIRELLDQVGALRLHRTSLRRAAIRAAKKGARSVQTARGQIEAGAV